MPGPAEGPTATIRVATYNLYLGADLTVIFKVASPTELADGARVVLDQVLATDFPARAEAIAALLVRDRVDLVGLQEVARWSRVPARPEGAEPQVWLDFLSVLLGALTRAGEAYDVHACTANFQGGAQVTDAEQVTVLGHNVILVRRGSGVRVVGQHARGFAQSLDITTGMPGLVLHVARSWSWVDAVAHDREFRFVNTHHEAWDESVRNAQRDELLAAAGTVSRPVIVVGDFNEAPGRVGMPPEYADAWAVAGRGGRGWTSGQRADLSGPTSGLKARIDYIWVRGAAVADCWVVGASAEDRTPGGLWPSDHAGVVAEIHL